MSFGSEEYLQWLFILPVLILFYIVRVSAREKNVKKWLGSGSSFLRSPISLTKRHFKQALGICVLALLFLALARPQSQGKNLEMKNKGLHILLFVDASRSMSAEDVKPSRLDFAKRELSRLIELSLGDQFALGFFARSAFLALPFTGDLSAVRSYLNGLSTDHLTNQGTDFERALLSAGKIFDRIKENQNEKAMKVLIIASDGEDHSKRAERAARALLSKQGVRIFTLSFGTKEGGAIPIKDHRGTVVKYKKDSKGDFVITRLREKSLRKFAEWGKGAYYHVQYGSPAIENLRRDLNRLEKTLFEQITHTQKRENYQWLLLLAFFLALLELIISDRANFGSLRF